MTRIVVAAVAVSIVISIVFLSYNRDGERDVRRLLKAESATAAVVAIKDWRSGAYLLRDPMGLDVFNAMMRTAQHDPDGPNGNVVAVTLEFETGNIAEVGLIADRENKSMCLVWPYSGDASFYTLRVPQNSPPSVTSLLDTLAKRKG